MPAGPAGACELGGKSCVPYFCQTANPQMITEVLKGRRGQPFEIATPCLFRPSRKWFLGNALRQMQPAREWVGFENQIGIPFKTPREGCGTEAPDEPLPVSRAPEGKAAPLSAPRLAT